MIHRPLRLAALLALLFATLTYATIFGDVRGIVHDPQHRPVEGAEVTLHARTSAWSQTARSTSDGEFELSGVAVGEYVVEVKAPGFRPLEQQIEVTSGSAPILHFQLSIETAKQSVEVSASPESINTESSTAETIVSRRQVFETPGADRTNSLAMITDYVPGASIVHDQLHIRGGHQISWEVDGVPVPNTSIATNVGPQFDPKDVDYVEMKTGGYAAEYGDRTYGVINVIPRSGFEYNNQGELVSSYGNFNQTNDQLSLGSHTEGFAYYASLNGNRSDLGLMTPASQVLHDMGSGEGGFGSLIWNTTPRDQLRTVASVRSDHYQIPNDSAAQVAGIRDLDLERDAFVNFSWAHTFSQGTLFSISPFYHFNRADFVGGSADTPIIPNDSRTSNYFGGKVTLSAVRGKHNAQIGIEAFAQHDDTVLSLEAGAGSGLALRQQANPWGNEEAVFLGDQYRLTSWLSLNGGVRLTRYSGSVNENGADPRLGAAIRVSKLGWILRGFYGRYFQPPPLDTVSGPIETLALKQGFGFLPLHGERDEQHEFGVTVPFRGWVLDADTFHTRARNFFDHDVLGNSNIFLPVTIQGARIYGWEATVRSRQFLRRAQVRLAYSRQYAEGLGAVSGGLTDFSPPPKGFFFLDHDQRNSLSGVFSFTLPRRTWATSSVSYGSGFLNGDGPAHLGAHTSFDLSLGKSFGEAWTVSLTAINAANRRFLVDNSNTFGGTHYADPRQVFAEIRYRFHY